VRLFNLKRNKQNNTWAICYASLKILQVYNQTENWIYLKHNNNVGYNCCISYYVDCYQEIVLFTVNHTLHGRVM